ncbi:MAG: hypothetical protein LKG26_01450 [Saccharofermentans sp.]|jgi:hypothetical protein|nr:hypothetical protein [Mageeibacillus sp.]MCI1263791.1 hypothetical protein [Saccharofermentans sp.]MCI1274742.1 hypothetical protein [Saccharofermentans sp.]MCI1769167.1 hypothetical protein [Mageeibacillus sp.]MCI2044712.1 hypothetical protein [Mageeibacillus sp.]
MNRKGFTWEDMLIVLIILGLACAVFIPVTVRKHEQSSESLDLDNLRDCEDLATIELESYSKIGWKTVGIDSVTFYYDAKYYSLDEDLNGIEGYGRGTGMVGSSDHVRTRLDYSPELDCKGKVIRVIINSDNTMSFSWVEPAS